MAKRLAGDAVFEAALLRAQAEEAADGMLVVSPGGELLVANRRFWDVWGFPPEVMEQGTDEAALAAAASMVRDPDAFLARIEQVYAERRTARDELELRDGRVLERYGAPLVGEDGTDLGYAWYFRDVTDRRRAAQELERLLAAERLAREAAEKAQARLAFLAEAGRHVASSLDREEILVELGRVAVPRLADWCSVYLPVDGVLQRIAMFGPPGREDFVARFTRSHGYPIDAEAPVPIAFRTGTSQLHRNPLGGTPAGVSGEVAEAIRTLDIRSTLIVPVVSRGQAHAVLSFAMEGGARSFSAADVALVEQLAARAGAAVDHALAYERERSLAVSLTRAVLPERLPRTPGLDLAARYRPAGPSVDVGGDWYDAFVVDGVTGVVIGDVAGHGVRAAAGMAQLRNAMRGYAVDRMRPGPVLEATSRLVEHGDDEVSFATAIVGCIDPAERTLRWASAGHPPPLLVSGRSATFLDGVQRPPLGADAGEGCGESIAALSPGDAVILYTDGLVERRGEALDESLEALRVRTEAAAGRGLSADAWCEVVLDGIAVGDGPVEDDCCVLVAVVR